MDQVLHLLQDGALLIATFGYAGIFGIMLVEGSGIPLPFPGTVFLAFVGYTIWRGQLGFAEATLAGAAGYAVGAWILYRVSRDAGPALLSRYGHRLSLTPEKVSRAQSWYSHHAIAATFVGRIVPGVRIYISIPAGLTRVHQGLFAVCTFCGILFWIGSLIGTGWALGESWRDVASLLAQAQGPILLVGGVIFLAILLLRRWPGEHDAR